MTDNGIIQVLNGVLMPNMDLTCPVCGLGFMTRDEMNAHIRKGHVADKIPEPILPVEEPLPPIEVITEPIPVVAKVTGVFEVITDIAGRIRFHLKAANGQIIAVSHSYGTKENALKGIASIKKNAPIAKPPITQQEDPCPSTKLESPKTRFLKFNSMHLIDIVSI